MERLDKILSQAAVATRKELRAFIRAGRIKVDGVVATTPEQKVDGNTMDIRVDDVPIVAPGAVVMLYKPAGYVTSTEDPRDPTVMELLPPQYRKQGLVPIGRLDKQTEGLLLFSNDGALSHWLLSPRHRVDKIYEAHHDNVAGEDAVAAFEKGLILADGTVCLPAKLEPLEPGISRITVQEGKYHQVRRMMAACGMHVTYLRRIGQAGLTLDGLSVGQWRELTRDELDALRN